MVGCYICGTQGADYRRTVYTGHSVGSWFGRRSSGMSTRTHYGPRTVCEGCAAQMDKGHQMRWAFIYLANGLLLLYLYFKGPN